MLIALFFLVNLLVIGIVFFLRWRGWRTAHIWMILTFISIIEWLLLILIRIENFTPFVAAGWFSIGDTPVIRQLHIVEANWPLAFAFVSTIPTFLLTGIARLDVRRDLRYWSAGILYISIGFLAVLTADLWSVVIFWTALDLLEVFYQLVVFNEQEQGQFQRSLIIRFLGSLLLVFATASLSSSSINPSLGGLSGSGGALVFVAAFLHSGILPLKQTAATDHSPQSEWILKRLIKLVILMASFSILIYFPNAAFSFIVLAALKVSSFLLVFRIGLDGITRTEKVTESEWFLFLAGFIVFLYLNSANLEFWLPALYLPSAFLIVHTLRSRSTPLFPLLMILMVSGLPYTVNAVLSRAFLFEEFRLSILWIIPPWVFFLMHFYGKSVQREKELSDIESIYQIVYLLGLLQLILTTGVISVKYLVPAQSEFALWWIGVIVLSLLTGLIMLRKNGKLKLPFSSKTDSSGSAMSILSLDWIFSSGSGIERRLKTLAASLSNMFEGAGGFLWALVLLVMILTVLR